MSNRTSAGIVAILVGLSFSVCGQRAAAQHLWWKIDGQRDATCLYGEITPLATHPGIYYCGANWHPGEPAGGYCGIQHNGPSERRTIFSIWDTGPKLHPSVSDADPKTVFNRFGGEGEGAHTHMLRDWQTGDTFQFLVMKQPGSQPDTTAARYYILAPEQKKWLHSATIVSPNGDKQSEKSVATLGGGGLASFLENFTGQDREVPKLALYRLWLGTSPEKMTCLTEATGDGNWGQLGDAYFLAEGNAERLDKVFADLKKQYGAPLVGQKGNPLAPISDKPLPPALAAAIKNCPPAPAVKAE
jgi:hypothetical protein